MICLDPKSLFAGKDFMGKYIDRVYFESVF